MEGGADKLVWASSGNVGAVQLPRDLLPVSSQKTRLDFGSVSRFKDRWFSDSLILHSIVKIHVKKSEGKCRYIQLLDKAKRKLFSIYTWWDWPSATDDRQMVVAWSGLGSDRLSCGSQSSSDPFLSTQRESKKEKTNVNVSCCTP